MNCGNCGAEINENDRFCSNCGRELIKSKLSNPPSGLIDCPDCKNPVSRRAKSCPNCGCPVDAMTPDGIVSIKLSNLHGTLTKQTVSIKDKMGILLWKGKAGQIAEFYLTGKTKIEIEYHIALNACGGYCETIIDPSKGTKYATTVRRGILSTHIEVQRVDIFDSDF